jgi:hypothetical protein
LRQVLPPDVAETIHAAGSPFHPGSFSGYQRIDLFAVIIQVLILCGSIRPYCWDWTKQPLFDSCCRLNRFF